MLRRLYTLHYFVSSLLYIKSAFQSSPKNRTQKISIPCPNKKVCDNTIRKLKGCGEKHKINGGFWQRTIVLTRAFSEHMEKLDGAISHVLGDQLYNRDLLSLTELIYRFESENSETNSMTNINNYSKKCLHRKSRDLNAFILMNWLYKKG